MIHTINVRTTNDMITFGLSEVSRILRYDSVCPFGLFEPECLHKPGTRMVASLVNGITCEYRRQHPTLSILQLSSNHANRSLSFIFGPRLQDRGKRIPCQYCDLFVVLQNISTYNL